jgi:hypothetical protein
LRKSTPVTKTLLVPTRSLPWSRCLLVQERSEV